MVRAAKEGKGIKAAKTVPVARVKGIRAAKGDKGGQA
ncbi:MAG: hypothetical protein K0R75_2042, partial [Paenibacillaceae bacterium]|nr:hypothetical protein [Paenibacillaceae bacterium]